MLSNTTHFRATCNFNTDGLVTTDYLRAKTTDLNILLLNNGIYHAMTVITAQPRCLKRVGTFTPFHTTDTLVSSQVLVTALLGHQVEKITLGITIHSN